MNQIETAVLVKVEVSRPGFSTVQHDCTGWDYDERTHVLKLYDQTMLKAVFANVDSWRVLDRQQLATQVSVTDAEVRLGALINTLNSRALETQHRLDQVATMMAELRAVWDDAEVAADAAPAEIPTGTIVPGTVDAGVEYQRTVAGD